MTLHLLKLCVGAESVDDHRTWIEMRLARQREAGLPAEHTHTTRMVPRRADEIVGKGSLYWVTRGRVQSRQRVIDIRPFTDAQGIGRCEIVLDPELVLTVPQPRRPFQGWRYLRPEDAPADLGRASGMQEMPASMRAELAELGLL
ncbi:MULTISPECIES: DUF1489 family protein [unclassified Roseitalea]|uniref:DUF1489 family protein n=1 Tax=unclassified Roseitalea TaxID=2639107 RepID=UPI00273F443F|nr:MULTISPECIES: DUF1489 family protein [unclassified Roseitalea]